MADDITIKAGIDERRNTYHIEIAMYEFHMARKAEQLIGELIVKVLRNILTEKYHDIQKIVDMEIYKPATRKWIEKEIREVIRKEVELHIKGMFDKE